MLLELHPTSLFSIKAGDFPLTHDCILKVEYIKGSPTKYQYFTTWSCDSSKISDIFLKSSVVKKVKIIPSDKLFDKW